MNLNPVTSPNEINGDGDHRKIFLSYSPRSDTLYIFLKFLILKGGRFPNFYLIYFSFSLIEAFVCFVYLLIIYDKWHFILFFLCFALYVVERYEFDTSTR